MAVGGGGVRVPITGDVTGLKRSLAEAEGSLKSFGDKTARFGQQAYSTGRALRSSLTLPIVGAGVAAGKLAFDFQDSMTKVTALVGVSQKQTAAWGKQILELAPKVAKSPKELADALYFITSSGISAAKTMDALTASAKLSAAGLGDTQGIADALTSALNAYAKEGLTAAKAGDIFTATVRAGKAEATQLAPVLGNVLPIAEQMGVSFDQVGAAIAEMTLKGTDAETAVTNLSAIFSTLLKPAAQSRKEMEKLGLSVDDVRKEMREKGMLATLTDLSKRIGGNQDALGKLFPNIRALRGFLQLTQGDVKATSKVFGEVKDSTGTMNKAFEDTAKTTDFKLRASFDRLQADAIKIGTILLPMAANVTDGIAKVVSAVGDLSGTQKKILAWSAAVVAAIGPVAMVVGATARGIGGLAKITGLGVKAVTGGKLAGDVGGIGVQRVFVVNMPVGGIGGRGIPGGVAGVGGVGAGAAGAAAAAGEGVAIPGIGEAGTLIGGAGGIGVGAALGIGAAAIVGGIAADKINQKTGFLGPAFGGSEADAAKQQAKIQNTIIGAWRKGGPAVIDEMKKWSLTAAITGPPMLAAARKGIDVFQNAITAGGPKVKHSTKELLGAAMQGLSGLSPQAQQLAADSMVRMSRTLENQGRLPVGSTKRLVAALTAEIGTLPAATQASARGVADALGGLVSTLGNVKSAVNDVARSIRNMPRPAPVDLSIIRGGATGAMLPGTYGGVDTMLMPVAPGEAILTPQQQNMVGVDRVMHALRATGGKVGGDGFASGGIVDAAYGRVQSKMGTKYVYGVWDCADFATYVAGVDVGGSTASAYADSVPAKGNEPIQWGLRKSHAGGYRGGPDEHMGVGVWHNGKMVWFDNGGHAGGSYVGSDSDSYRWQDYRVPKGLQALSRDGAIDTKKNTKGRGRPEALLSKSAIQRILRGPSAVGAAPTRSDVLEGSIEARHRDDSLQDKQTSASATSAAQARGVTNPDKLSAIADKAVDDSRLAEIKADIGDVNKAATRVRKAIAAGRKRLSKLYLQLRKAKTRDRENALVQAINDQRSKNGDLITELKGYIKQAADLQAEANEYGYDAGQLAQQIAQLPDVATDTSGGTDTSVSADAQAQIDQANTRASVAERASGEFGAFVGALRGSGDIDPGAGITVHQYVYGGLIQQAQAGSWIVDALNQQGSPSSSRVVVPT